MFVFENRVVKKCVDWAIASKFFTRQLSELTRQNVSLDILNQPAQFTDQVLGKVEFRIRHPLSQIEIENEFVFVWRSL